MNQRKHTPGPWKLDVDPAGTYWELYDETGYGHFICSGPDDPTKEDIANARLISVAPDLLKFGKWAIQQFQGESGAGHNYWEQFPEYIEGIQAVEKAEGQDA